MVSLVILIFLWHIPSALIPILTIPIAVLISFIPMHAMGMTSNIMSLGGIAIAIGAMVDAAIVVVEQTHKKLEARDAGLDASTITSARSSSAVKEVGGPSFFSLLVIAVAFLPVFTLEAQEGPALQAAGLHQELRHGGRGGARDHARSGAAPALLPHGQLPHPAALARQDRQRRSGRQDSFRGEAPDQPRPDALVRARVPLRRCAGSGW